MARSNQVLIASVNVNGIRAADRNGMTSWIAERKADIVTLQEVRAEDAIFHEHADRLWGAKWNRAHAESEQKGRAGVAIISRHPLVEPHIDLGPQATRFDRTGRWVEASVSLNGLDAPLTVISAYVHTGDADDAGRMEEKLSFFSAMTDRMEQVRATGRHVVLTGDLNVGHTERDIKNWKGNRGKAGFLEVERAWFDTWFNDLGWVDVARSLAGDSDGPYTWWSFRGQAFDKNVGWRIDYQVATPEFAALANSSSVDRAPSYAERWSDHAPLVVTYKW